MADVSQSFFDPNNSANTKALLPLQIGVMQGPTPTALNNGTGLILPDQHISARLNNFPGDLYDLSPTSHLVRFMTVMLGDAGVGQLRKLQLVSRLAGALTSTHFFDLDRFYGAIFGATRAGDEILASDPMTTPATPDEWDLLQAADASYREKIIALARSIEMGATPLGIQAAAEAVLGAPVALYEDWQLLDPLGRNNVGSDTQSDSIFSRTWAQVQSAYATYGDMDGLLWANITMPGTVAIISVPTREYWQNVASDFGPNYSNVEGSPAHTWGRLENVTPVSPPAPVIPYGDRFGFHIVPLKKYDDPDPQVNLKHRSGDIYQIQRVLERLKPAGAFMYVDPQGIEAVTAIPIANLTASSSYWDIDYTVSPKAANAALYPVSALQAAAGVSATDPHTPPIYAWGQSQATEWHYNGDIVRVVAYTEDENQIVSNPQEFEIVTFFDGTQVSYTADRGLQDTAQAWGAINSATTVASPYVASRAAVV